ncbi:MAG: hypothetical protein JWP72_3540 [Massilia sp.]|nr:hypothetical protein [Massilia sp.]
MKTIMPEYRSISIALMMAFASQANAATYVWDAQKSDIEKRIPRVTLSNKAMIEELRGEALFEQSITAKTSGSKQKSVLAKNDFAQIEAAYPGPQQASAVLVSDSCSGSICDWKNLTMVIPQNGAIKTYRIGSPTKITLTLAGDQVVGGQADGIPAGEDKYGSRITTTRRFIPGAGFVAAGFKNQYARLVGEHPERFFDDPALREPFAKATGMENFRDLRQAISVASPVNLVQGRYIVMQGCMPHDCGGNYSFVMIDAVTSDFYWARFREGANRYSGATRKLDREAIQFVLADEEFSQHEDAPLVISPAGKIVYKRKTR